MSGQDYSPSRSNAGVSRDIEARAVADYNRIRGINTGDQTVAMLGLPADVTTFLLDPTSVNLAVAMLTKTGDATLVFNESPSFITPDLGTPTSGTLTNCIGLPASALDGVVPPANLGTGGTGGTTRYLREDGAWTVPPSGGATTPTFVDVDFGIVPKSSGSFTLTIAASAVGSLVEIWETAETIVATGELADRLECDQIMAQGLVTASTTATVRWLSVPGSIGGTRRFAYNIIAI